MLYKMIFKEDEIPFEELSEIGITKENFFNLPIDILNRILLGRLSPVMEFKILVDGESHILKGKFAFHRKDEKVQYSKGSQYGITRGSAYYGGER
mgnify:CR=1 FL=1